MNNYKIYFSILFIAMFFSCNMGKRYANMRIGDGVEIQNKNPETREFCLMRISENSLPSRDTNKTQITNRKDKIIKEKLIVRNLMLNENANSRPEIVSEPLTQQNSISAPLKKPQDKGGGMATMVLLVFILAIILLFGIALLIAWIFVPFLTALRIILWSFLIFILLWLLIALILNLLEL